MDKRDQIPPSPSSPPTRRGEILFGVPEILSDKAELLLANVERGDIELQAPDPIYPEAGNILWKKERLKELTPSEVEEITDAILSLPLRIEPSKTLLPLSVEIAMAYGLTVYDAMYITLAKVCETTMITADRKLTDALSKTDMKDTIAWLGSYK